MRNALLIAVVVLTCGLHASTLPKNPGLIDHTNQPLSESQKLMLRTKPSTAVSWTFSALSGCLTMVCAGIAIAYIFS